MIRVQQLRHGAERARRMASIPTNGDALTDRALLELADQLEQEAASRMEHLKREAAADKPA